MRALAAASSLWVGREPLLGRLDDAIGQGRRSQLTGIEHQLVDGQVGEVYAVQRQVPAALDTLALLVVGQRPLDRHPRARGHPLGPDPGGSVDPDDDRRQPLVVRDPARQPRFDDGVAVAGPAGEAAVELDVDLGVVDDVEPELRQAHAALRGQRPEHLAAQHQLEVEPVGHALSDRGGARARRARDRDQQVPAEGETALERVEQRAALLLAQAPHPAGVGDADLFHGPAGAYLAYAWERLEHCEYLHLAHDVVVVGLVEELLEGQRPHLELLLELGSGAACLGCLRECCFALLGSQSRWLRHAAHPSATPQRSGDNRRQTSGATSARAAARGSGARVTGRPTISRSAPDSSAWRGVATRPWSSMPAPSGRMPGVASTAAGAIRRIVSMSETAQTKPPQPPSRPAVTRWCNRWCDASGSLVRTVTPMATGSGSSAPAAPSRSPSTPARSIGAPPDVWSVR